jgi:putative endonuclease
VAANSSSLVFCEVKTRVLDGAPGELGPFAALGPDKRRRVRRMAREWLCARESRELWPSEIRFDAIGISLDRAGQLLALDHLEGAF